MSYKSVLIISDTHFPYGHVDTIPFLAALKKKYKPDKIIHIGDEIDNHAISFHESNPELLSPANELKAAITQMKRLYKLFPKVQVLESNHGSLVFRRATAHGIPLHVFKSYREILEAPAEWSWHNDLIIKTPNGPVYFTHGKSAAMGKLSQSMGMSSVQGHYHERFEIFHWSSPAGLFFDMRVGCLIDDNSLAMAYNNTNLKRPIMGCGMIIDGKPRLMPMELDGRGRWNKNTP